MISIASIVVRSLSSLVSVTSSFLTLINDNFYRNRVGWTWLIVRNQIFCFKCLPLLFISFFNSEPGTDKFIVRMVTRASVRVKSGFSVLRGSPWALCPPHNSCVPHRIEKLSPHLSWSWQKFFRYFFQSLYDKGLFDQHNKFRDANCLIEILNQQQLKSLK